jgi:hypothetical protein
MKGKLELQTIPSFVDDRLPLELYMQLIWAKSIFTEPEANIRLSALPQGFILEHGMIRPGGCSSLLVGGETVDDKVAQR